MNNVALDRKVCDLTVLEFQDLLDSLEDSESTSSCAPPEQIDIAARVGDLTVRQLVSVLRYSLPRGIPNP